MFQLETCIYIGDGLHHLNLTTFCNRSYDDLSGVRLRLMAQLDDDLLLWYTASQDYQF